MLTLKLSIGVRALVVWDFMHVLIITFFQFSETNCVKAWHKHWENGKNHENSGKMKKTKNKGNKKSVQIRNK